jgi:two-component system OmpR family sensor kinase
MYSLKGRLLAAIFILVSLTFLLAAAATFYSVQSEVDKLLDTSLKQVALSLKNYRSQDILALEKHKVIGDQNVVIQIYDPISGLKYISRKMEYLPILDRVGFSDIHLDGQAWRVYTTQNASDQIIEVAQPTFLRGERVFQAAKLILLPLFITLPITGLILWLIVGQGLSSIKATATAISRRSPSSLRPLSMKGLPTEIAPLVSALNGLLSQLNESINTQKRFASDAAHELRTPLTALTLQIQLAERAKTDEARQKAFGKLKDGVKRATRLVTQLLTMARLDPDNREKPLLPLDLHALAVSVSEDLSVIAQQKNISLLAAGKASVLVVGNEDALRLVMNNLCDNAMRYTPEHGHIEIRTWAENGKAFIEVADDGPGIPEAERPRIFERFYRAAGTQTIPGTGLGLAIVRRVSELHGGSASVGDGINGKGVSFRIEIPTHPHANQEEADPDEEVPG